MLSNRKKRQHGAGGRYQDWIPKPVKGLGIQSICKLFLLLRDIRACEKEIMKMLKQALIVILITALAVCAGCESHAQNKKAAKDRWDKTSAQIKVTLAQQQYNEGEYDKALKTIEESIEADADNYKARVLYGKILLVNGHRNEAIVQLSIALLADENLDDGWYWLGVTAQESRDYEKARECYGKALMLRPTNVEYILASAEVEVACENYSLARKLLSDGMLSASGNVSLKAAAADLMMRMGRNREAVSLYREAMLMAGDDESIAESLGYCYMFSGEWEKAAEIFDSLVKGSGKEDEQKLYLQVLALCSMNCSQYGRAANCYSELSIERRDDAEIWLKMGQASLGAGALNRAFMCGQKAISLRPGYKDAIALLGSVEYTRGNYKGALMNFEKLASDRENMGFSWLMRGRCYERLGLKREAESAYKKAVEINPQSKLGDLLVKGEGR